MPFYLVIFFLIFNFILFKLLISLNLNFIPIDHPSDKKIHSSQSKLLGGIVFLINLIFCYILIKLGFLNNPINIKLINIFVIISIFIISLMDDFALLGVFERIILYILSISIFLIFNPELQIYYLTIQTLGLTFDFQNYSFLFSIFCIFSFMNACNFFDGYNLQISNYFLFLVLVLITFYKVFFLLIFLPFLICFSYYNKNGKIFMGNSGTFLISFFLSFIIIFLNKTKMITAEEILKLMFLPGIDMIRLFVTRIFNKKVHFLET